MEKKSSPHICPVCGSCMHSKGFYCRKVNDPILINGRQVILLVYARKWICPVDNTRCSDVFNFVERHKRNTSLTPYRIVDMMKDLALPISHIARMFNVSDTYCFECFNRLVDLERLPLGEAISIDEVFLNIGKDERYVMVIMDYKTKEIIDILPNRYESTVSNYFLRIPLEERKKVKYLVTDMYKPYLNFTHRFFPNSVSLVDSFHIVSKLISDIGQYIYIYISRQKKIPGERSRTT